MRLKTIFGIATLIGVQIGATAAHAGTMRVVPRADSISGAARKTFVTVTSTDMPTDLRPQASVIVYAPDGTMVRKPQSKRLRASTATFKILLGANPQPGTYTVFATTEAGANAVGMPTTFQVLPD